MEQIMKCRNCGADIDLRTAVGGVVECEYCGSKFTAPKEETPDIAKRYLHDGESALFVGDFDKAYSLYGKAAELAEKEPEAYFGMALAQFKVRYLSDKVNDRLQPIVGKVTEDKLSDNGNYNKALKLATPKQKALYVEKSAEIDYIREEFFKLEKSRTEYDCFICVKVTDNDTGGRTRDYKSADDIYYELRRKGYKPFFSENDLRNVTGADYEVRILYALKKSECMLIVCSDEEYLQTKWVKNEYSRFLSLVNDQEKESDSIAIAYDGRPIEHLPGKNGKLQGINLRALNAMELITDFVEKHTPAARKRRKDAEEKKNRENDALKEELAALKTMLLNQQAQQTSAATKEKQPKAKAKPVEAKEPAAKPVATKAPAEKGDTFAIGKKIKFGRYSQTSAHGSMPISWTIIDRAKDRKGERVLLLSDKILDAYNVQYVDVKPKGKEKIYGDDYAASEIRRWLNNDFYNKAFADEEKDFILTTTINNIIEGAAAIVGKSKYICEDTQDKVFLLSNAEKNRYLKTEEDKKRPVTLYAQSCGATSYWLLRAYLYSTKSGSSRQFFGIVPAIWIKCDEGIVAIERKLNKLATEENNSDEGTKRYEVGEKFTWGNYPQSSAATKEPIVWTIIKRTKDAIFILSDKVLDGHRFGERKRPKLFGPKIYSNNYAESEIREWLNKDFYAAAFSPKEQLLIMTKEINNSAATTGVDENKYACEDTKDRVFLLSRKEVATYLKGKEDKSREVTVYAEGKGASDGHWLTRSPSPESDTDVQYVGRDGQFFGGGTESVLGIVPAMWIQLPQAWRK